jgi:hypothetical protein
LLLAENGGMQSFLKKMIPKVLKATVKGLLWFFLLFVLPTSLLGQLEMEALRGYTELFTTFAIVIVFFVVVSELLAGTIFKYALDMGKALVFMVFFIYALNGGFMTFDLPLEIGMARIEADLRVYLAMLLTIDFLGLARSVLQAIEFLVGRTERQLTI